MMSVEDGRHKWQIKRKSVGLKGKVEGNYIYEWGKVRVEQQKKSLSFKFREKRDDGNDQREREREGESGRSMILYFP